MEGIVRFHTPDWDWAMPKVASRKWTRGWFHTPDWERAKPKVASSGQEAGLTHQIGKGAVQVISLN